MANGDAAAAVGMDIVPGTADVRQGYDEINKSRDYLAAHETTGTHPWANVTGKPTTFPPSAHGHDWSQVNVPGNGALSAYMPAALANKRDLTNKDFGSDSAIISAYARNHSVTTSYVAAYINSDGQILASASSRSVKNPIQDYTPPENILDIQPVVYAFKDDPDQVPRLGLYAEDTNEIEPLLVNHTDGQPAGVKYEVLAVALLGVVKDLAARVAELEQKNG